MTAGRATGAALALGLLALVGARAAEYARLPEFPIELVRHRKMAVRAEGARLERHTPLGTITIEAARMAARHEEIGPLRLGPATGLALEGVTATLRDGDRLVWVARGREATLDSRTLEIAEGARLIEPTGAARRARSIRIDLGSGEVNAKAAQRQPRRE